MLFLRPEPRYRILLEQSKDAYRKLKGVGEHWGEQVRKFGELFPHWTKVVATITLVSVIVYYLYIPGAEIAYGASYTFTQSNWAGGANSAIAGHPGNETGWNKYTSGTNISTAGTTTAGAFTVTDDGTLTTTGGASGGGFGNGSNSNTAAAGSGSSGSVSLAVQSSTENHTMTRLADTPNTDGGNTNNPLLRDDNSDYIYQATASGFARYSISGNSWVSLTSPPASFDIGVSLVMQSSSSSIYAVRAGGTNSFYRYSIPGNSWSSLSNIPGTVNGSYSSSPLAVMSQDGLSIYAIGGYNSNAFYRFSVTSSSWTTLTNIPAALRSYNYQLYWDGSEAYIYVLRGSTGSVGTATELYRYSIAGNSWTTLNSLPTGVGTGDVVRAPNGGDIFMMGGGPGPNSLYRYYMASSSWAYLRDDNTDFTDGVALHSDSADDSIYIDSNVDISGSPNTIKKYSIASNSFTSYARPAACGSDQIINWIRRGTDNFIYFLAYQNGGGTRFCVDSINNITYQSSGTFTSATIDLGTASTFSSISWATTTPSGVGSNSVRFQLAANNDNATWNYVGPDGTSGTYFTTNGGITFPSSLNNKRYLRYKAYFATSDTSVSPSLDSITFSISSSGVGGGSFVAPTISIASHNYTATDDGSFSTNGGAGGGGFGNGTTSNTAVSGSGSSALIKLAVASSTILNQFTYVADGPDSTHGGAQILRAPGSDYIYVLPASNSADNLLRYSLSNNTWTSLAAYQYAYFGAQLFWDYSSDYMYLVQGHGNTAFERYSISGNSWSFMADLPAAPDQFVYTAGTIRAGEDFIYFLRGTGNTNLYRYSIGGNSWSSMASAPAALGDTPQALRNEAEDYIYVVSGAGTNKLYRYSIGGNSWATLANLPANLVSRVYAVRDDGSDYIYVKDDGHFYRYSIGGNSWTTLSNGPGVNGGNGSTLLHYPGEDLMYFVGGSACCGIYAKFWKYSIGGDTWTLLDTATGHDIEYGTPNKLFVRNGNDEEIYGTFANGVDGTGEFAKIILNQTTYQTSGSFTSATLDLGAAQLNSLSWSTTTPSGVGSNSVKFQLAANNDNSTWSYVGPDGTNSTYFTTNGGTSFPSTLLNKRYWRYKAFFTTSDTSVTPSLNSITFSFASYGSPTAAQTTDGATLSTTGLATGGGFSNGATSTTQVSAGAVKLSSSLIPEAHIITQLADAPRNMGSTWLWNGTEDSIYSLVDYMWKYSIAGNSWTQLAQIPGAFGQSGGLQMIRNNNEDLIYAITSGPNPTYFSKYSITNDAWTRLADVPGAGAITPLMVRYGTEDYIYLAPDLATTTFYRYSIAGNSWSTLAPMPSELNLYHRYARLIRSTGDDYIYISDSQGPAYRYSIANNSWITLTSKGNQMIRNGADDEIYSIVGSASPQPLQRYSVLNNSFTDLASTPSGINDWAGTILVRYGSSDYIYGISVVTTTLSRYSIINNAWSAITNTLPIAPSVEDDPPLLSADGNDMYIMFRNNAALVKDSINAYLYSASGNFTSASIDLGGISTLTQIAWTSSTPSGVGAGSIKFQLAGNNDNSTWNFVGPDGTNSTYFTTNGGSTFPGELSGMRYFKYKAFLTTADSTVSPSLNSVILTHNTFTAQGTLISSIYDSVDPTNILASIAWDAYLPAGGTARFQMRSAGSTTTLANATWVGPDGTSATYFTASAGEQTGAGMRDGNADRYFQYQVFLGSTNFSQTPAISSVTVTYVVNAPPEIRNITATPNSDGTVSISYEIRDPDANTGSFTPGYVTPSFQYCVSNSSCQTISALAANGTSNKAVDITNWTTVTTSWTPATDFPNQSTTHAEVRLTINDNELANNTAVSTTVDFILDSTPPANPSVTVDATYSPARLTFSASDTSTLQMRFALSTSTLAATSYSSYSSSSTISLASVSSTVYAQFKDAYGNTTAVVSAPLPSKPAAVAAQDTSNMLTTPPDYRIFIAWQRVSDVNFASYKVYRSLDSSSWSVLATVPSSTTNFYTDYLADPNTVYYYKIASADTAGNISFASSPIATQANGAQDQGEGGGGTPAAPAITNVTSTSIGPTSAVITWNTNSLSDSTVGYSSTPDDYSTTVNVPSMVDNAGSIGAHTVILDGLSPGTTYYYNASSMDINNLSTTASSSAYTFTTLAGPVISNVAVTKVYNTKAIIHWDTDIPANATVIYSTSPAFNATSTASSSTLENAHTITLSGLSPATQYFFYVRSRDEANVTNENKNVVDGVNRYYAFNTPSDISGPAITNITSQSSTTTLGIFWDTDEESTSQLQYGTSTAYGTTTTLDSVLTTQHNVSIESLLPNTLYHFRLYSTDGSGNTSVTGDQTAATAAADDTTPPAIFSIATSSVTLTSATITWTTDEPTNGLVEYGTNLAYSLLAGDAANFVSSTHSVTLTNLEGNTTYHFRVRSADFSGNTTVNDNSGDGYTFTTTPDSVSPTISSISAQTTTSTLAVFWTTSEAADSQIEYGTTLGYGSTSTLDTTLTIQHNTIVSGLTANTLYHYRIRTTDASGNTAVSTDHTATTVALGDSTGPVISSVATSSVGLSSAVVTWTTDENSNALVEYGTSNSYGSIAGNAGSFSSSTHSVTLTNLSGNTTYYFKVRSTDQFGNMSSDDNGGNSYTFRTLPDSTAPTISSISVQPTTSTLGIFWTTSENADSQVEYGTTAAYGATTTLDSTLTIQHLVNVTGLTNATLYHYRIRTADASGNVGYSGDRTATTLSVADTTPPTISAISAGSISLTGATISWNTNENANGLVEYGTSNAYGSIAGDAGTFNSTAHSVALTGLTGNTTYYYKVRSTDFSGNTTVDDNNGSGYTFTTSADATPPTISNVALSVISDTSATIVWNTNEAANSRVEYGTSTSYGAANSSATYETTHVATLSGLTPQTTYYFRVISADASSNSATSDNSGNGFTFTTDQAHETVTVIVNTTSGGGGGTSIQLDSTAPVLSDVVISNVTTTSAVLSWTTNESSNSLVQYGGTIAYGKLAGDYVKRGTTHNVTLTELKPGTTYHFQAMSTDAQGNIGMSNDILLPIPNEQGITVPPVTPTSTPEVITPPEQKPADDLSAKVAAASPEEIGKIFTALKSNPYLSTLSEDMFIKAVTELANRIIQPPSIVGPQPEVTVEGTVATVRWATDKNASSLVLYSEAGNYKPKSDHPYDNAATNPDEFSTSHTVVLSGLTPGAIYHFQVVSKAILGPESKSFDNQFITASELPKITNISVQRTDETNATLAWKTNVPTAATIKYTNGSTKESLTQGDTSLLLDHLFTLRNLNTGIEYTTVIKVVDEGGNTSESLPIKFTTSRDINAPLISNVNTETTLFPGQNSKVQAVISWDTNEPATSQVFYQEGFNSSSTVAVPIDELFVARHVTVLTKLKPGTVYRYWVESRDVNGNLARSEIFSVLTAQERETIIDVLVKNFDQVFGWTKRVSF